MTHDTVLVTGGGGFIGASVARALLDQGVPVALFDQRPPTAISDSDPIAAAPFYFGDILDSFALLRALTHSGAKRVVHAAAIVGAGLSIDNPVRTITTNLLGITNVLEAARSLDLGRIVLISSQSVYGPGQYEPVDELHPTDPDSPYGVTKLAAEKWGNVYASAFGVDFVSLRMPHIYGPGRPAGLRGNVIQDMLEAAQIGKPFHMARGGDQTKEPVYILDITRATLAALDVAPERLEGRSYNIGTGVVLTWKQIAAAIRELYPDATMELGDGPMVVRNGVLEQPLGPLSYDRAHRVLDYTPHYHLRDGLAHFDKWLTASRAHFG
ncbi:NAD-dependent epimerase/dehydratase family protein [Acuticoccus mangrovi]|uniref:NAD(P)-dependent oxidoreductase n=1 Tax=Acuticoccus mangrovi TaxID=2796142 RepID=A0A934IS89_9HYPH|nr:NAD(P)-dependent oxidoreductase [Acuticoccus mangrovi]MBJ3777105.1 NAD(P)-dependent oxidoreductase [Acuticoccus mangrovi]